MKHSMAKYCSSVIAASCLAFMLSSSTVIADADFNGVADSVSNTAVTTLTASGLAVSPFQFTVHVDKNYCVSAGVQCETGLLPESTNGEPIRLLMQVTTRLGQPVAGLVDADFAVLNPFTPAGGTAVAKTICGACFQNGGNGVYALFVDPRDEANWKAGGYGVQITVTSTLGDRLLSSSALIDITIDR